MIPVAIVGRACLLPGANSPQALWQAIVEGRDLTSQVPAARWRLPPELALSPPGTTMADRSYGDRGGYVEGFDALWDPRGFALPAEQLACLDTLVHWSLHCAREALTPVRRSADRVGLVLGNLGFPSESMAIYADQIWRGEAAGDARNRHMSGGTAQVLAQALDLQAGSYCIDAACASSLYAIQLACAQLAIGQADLMLAGAVQRADDLFLHIGFSALGALSRSGQSRPFHRDADGLLPAEGCALLALKRLSDARRDGDTVYAVIRGIGLSNDGRGKGLLAPDEAGQQRALRAAYADAGLDPQQISLLECHATGTPVGDAAELRSGAAVFADQRELPIGSLKSNLGHLITAAGAAGLIKLTEALRHRQRPPNRPVDAGHDALQNGPFRLLQQPEDWPSPGPRVAAISAFGFGGNNAHLIVSEDDPELSAERDPAAPTAAHSVAIVGLGCRVGALADRAEFTAALFDRDTSSSVEARRCEQVELDLAGLRFPPRDLQQTLPQQLLLLACAREALAETGPLPGARCAVLVGMEPDAEVARYGSRWRCAVDAGGDDAAAAWIAPLEAAGVLGCMPNLAANRLSAQYDLGGPSYTVQAGAASGVQALTSAWHGIRSGAIDAALVAAVDLCCEPVTQAAGNNHPLDAAVVLVLKRLADAERDGDRIYALLQPASATPGVSLPPLQQRFGDGGAAASILQVAAACLCLHHRRHDNGRPWLSTDPRRITLPAAGAALELLEARAYPRRSEHALPRLHRYRGADRAQVLHALEHGREGGNGPAQLVLVATAAELDQVRARAIAHLREGAPAGSAVHFRECPLVGELAFVFAAAGAAYAGMGRELLQQWPQLLDALASRSRRLSAALAWAYDPDHGQPSALEQLWGASALSQLHREVSTGLLGLRPDAWLGCSSGETNALVAAGVWNDADALMDEMEASGLVTRLLGGEFAAVAPQWGRPVQWASYTVLAPVADVRAALQGIERVHLAIVHSDADCLIAGEESSCMELVRRIGPARCVRLEYPLAVHVPELGAVAADWLELHRRETAALRSGRVYGSALGCSYAPNREACAQAILAQAQQTLDLRPVVLRAWEDGVRIFIEHGPGNSFARAIRSILGEREALVLSLDRKGQGLEGVLGCAAALLAAGIELDIEALHRALQPASSTPPPQRPMRFAAHWPAVVWPPAQQVEKMAPAPALPPVLDLGWIAMPEPLAASVVVPGTTAHTPAPVRGNRSSAALLQRQHTQWAQLSGQQQRYLETSAQAQQQFLALRAQAQQVLLQAMRGVTHEPAPPAAPPTIPAPFVVTTIAHANPSAAPEPSSPDAICGPAYGREQLLIHADGRISEIFGPEFAAQDGYARQVRMPRPPLLLADRVLGIDGVAGSMGRGRIWTETDVGAQDWYLHQGFMPAGVMIEAGQADLLLISWLGVDAHNRGERVYRLLGCELCYHGDLPRRGDTLRFDIRIDGHAAQGDVRLMFFHYDCHNGARKQLSVRRGQAGFFTDAELAESAGCLWSPQQQEIVNPPQLDPPEQVCQRQQLSRAHLEAFAAGDAASCFGPGFERARTHSRSPGIHGGRMLLLDRVTALELNGGPWQRGYLRAELDITPQHWFFDGHFKNDPCMPGTLMFEACLQAMALYLGACGYTLQRDGWRFQPVPDLPYQLQCRGQVTPRSRLLLTEVFIEERSAGPEPTIWADLLCTVDGLKAFHARRVALQLVPDWPLDELAPEAAPPDQAPVATVDGFAFDRRSLLACALGRPSQAFGPMYRRFDGPQRVARLPSPPYHFISRIAKVDGPIGVMRAGARVVAEYDLPGKDWYFEHNSAPVMPFAVLLEAALQPCGWLSSYVGSALTQAGELGFRNLDGEGTVLAELHPQGGTLRTEVELLDVSASAGMIIESFAVRCHLNDREVYTLRTVFGFFPPEALAAQVGLPVSAEQRELLQRPGNLMLDTRASQESQAMADMPRDMLRMIDRIEGYWPEAGAAGLGQLRALKQIDSGEWFFKAHFFQDPVQPGSLGLEAMLQTLQFYLLQQCSADQRQSMRMQSIALGRPQRWKYRGQVLPQHRQVHTTLEITERGHDQNGPYAIADASLWVDGQRIYEASGLGVRLVPVP